MYWLSIQNWRSEISLSSCKDILNWSRDSTGFCRVDTMASLCFTRLDRDVWGGGGNDVHVCTIHTLLTCTSDSMHTYIVHVHVGHPHVYLRCTCTCTTIHAYIITCTCMSMHAYTQGHTVKIFYFTGTVI